MLKWIFGWQFSAIWASPFVFFPSTFNFSSQSAIFSPYSIKFLCITLLNSFFLFLPHYNSILSLPSTPIPYNPSKCFPASPVMPPRRSAPQRNSTSTIQPTPQNDINDNSESASDSDVNHEDDNGINLTCDNDSSDGDAPMSPSTRPQHQSSDNENIPQSPTSHSSVATFLSSIPELASIETKTPFELQNTEEMLVFKVFNSNEPFAKTQLLDHPILKAANIKRKTAEEALDRLIERQIIIAQPLAGSKNILFYANQSLRPQCSAESLQKLKDIKGQLASKIAFATKVMNTVKMKIETIKKAPKTEQIVEEVNSLKQIVAEQQQKLQLLRKVSSDPNYINSLKQQYASNIVEWSKRKRKMDEMAEPYLANVTKKQRVFYKDIGCEDEEVELKISYQDFIDYGKQQNILDQSGKPFRTGISAPVVTSYSEYKSSILPPSNTSARKNGYDPVLAPMTFKPGQNRASVLMQRVEQQQITGNGPKLMSIEIPPLQLRTIPKKPFQDEKSKQKK